MRHNSTDPGTVTERIREAVIEEFHHGTFQNYALRQRRYNKVWGELAQKAVEGAQKDEGKLFYKDMNRGTSDIGLGLQFIPRPGRKSHSKVLRRISIRQRSFWET